MIRKLVEPLILFASSLISLALNYFKFPISAYQQIIAVLVVVMLIIFNYYSPTKQEIKQKNAAILTYLTLFLTSLFVQLLIISTGALFSPFLILIHLFVLGTSFLVNLRSAVSFLILAMAVLIVTSLLSPEQKSLIMADPGTALLFLASFIVILPLAYLISTRYHLKDALTKVLTKRVELSDSIVESLNDLVINTDPKLKIVSVNEAVLTVLGLQKNDLLGKLFFNVIDLKNESGVPGDLQSLSIEEAIREKDTRIVNGFYLYTKSKPIPYKVTIWVRPSTDSEGKLDQISFVITEGKGTEQKGHLNLQQATKNQLMRFQALEKNLQNSSFKNLSTLAHILEQAEKDILLANELEDHPIKPSPRLLDLALLSKQTLTKKQELATSLNVKLDFKLPEEERKEQSLLNLSESNIDPSSLPPSEFTLALDQYWFRVLLEKLMDVAIFISSGEKDALVTLEVKKINKGYFNLIISATSSKLELADLDHIFDQYYGNLNQTTNLKLGSGLEGSLAKSISTQLNVQLATNLAVNPARLNFTLTVSRDTKS